MESTNRDYNTQDNASQYGSSYNPYASGTYTTNYTTNYTTGGVNSSPVVATYSPNNFSSDSKSNDFLKTIIGLFYILALISPCILASIINKVAFGDILDEEDDGEYEYQYTTNYYDDYNDDFDDYYDDWYDDWYNDDTDADGQVLPYSDVYKAFAEEVFGKPYDEVTPEEYATVTYIHAYAYDDIIDYAINDGEIKSFTYSDGIYDYLDRDIKCFTGLKVLDVESDSFYLDNALEGLTELKEVWSGNSVGELANLLEKPENIEVLGISDSFNEDSLSGIESFVNVKKLYVNSNYVKSLDGLEALTKLEDLTILDGDNISNFTALCKINGLKKLYISSDKLMDLSIIENMTELEELSVLSSELTDISLLSNMKGTLKKLELTNVYKVEDYSIIDELINLEDLSLFCAYDAILPTLKNMNNLKKIYLYGADDISFIANATNLEEIDLKWCNFNDEFPLSNLQFVKYLKIDRPYSFPYDMNGVAAMKSLETLDISSLLMFGNAEAIFTLPNLKVLLAEDASFGIDLAKMTTNNSLEVVDFNDAYISKYVFVDQEYYDYYKEEEVDAAYLTNILGYFPNVKELYIKNFKLGDISFTKNLSKLEKLDITDNDVTQLKPLAELANLQCVWCVGNSIIDSDSLPEKVQLIFEEKY